MMAAQQKIRKYSPVCTKRSAPPLKKPMSSMNRLLGRGSTSSQRELAESKRLKAQVHRLTA